MKSDPHAVADDSDPDGPITGLVFVQPLVVSLVHDIYHGSDVHSFSRDVIDQLRSSPCVSLSYGEYPVELFRAVKQTTESLLAICRSLLLDCGVSAHDAEVLLCNLTALRNTPILRPGTKVLVAGLEGTQTVREAKAYTVRLEGREDPVDIDRIHLLGKREAPAPLSEPTRLPTTIGEAKLDLDLEDIGLDNLDSIAADCRRAQRELDMQRLHDARVLAGWGVRQYDHSEETAALLRAGEEFFEKAEAAWHKSIAERAYYLWEAAGKPQGRDKEFWEEANRRFIDDANARTTVPSREAISRAILAGQPIRGERA